MSEEDEGPVGDPGHEQCVVEQSDEGEGVWNPFEAEYDAVDMPPTQKPEQADGMPGVHAPVRETDIPKLSPETLICMGKFDRFVLRDEWRQVVAEFTPEQIDHAPDGRYRVTVMRALDNMPRSIRFPERFDVKPPRYRTRELVRLALASVGAVRRIDRGEVGALFDESILGDYHDGWVEVEPIRPPCRHYIRQRSQFSLNPKHKEFFRLCALRRTTEGAMMTVKDWGMWACDGRDPRDPESEETINDFDNLKVEQGKRQKHLPMFDVDMDESEGAGGIFGGQSK
jgi:hypothetical protein